MYIQYKGKVYFFFSEGYVTFSLFVPKLLRSISTERNPTNQIMLEATIEVPEKV